MSSNYLIDTVDSGTLQALLNLIEDSDCPEQEAEYLGTEFGIRTDLLFTMFLETKKSVVVNSVPKNNVVSGTQVRTYERRKSPPQVRLRYGILKSLNVNGKDKSSLEQVQDKGIYFLVNYLSEEFSRYKFSQKNSNNYISSLEVLNKSLGQDLDLQSPESLADELIKKIIEQFDISYT